MFAFIYHRFHKKIFTIGCLLAYLLILPASPLAYWTVTRVLRTRVEQNKCLPKFPFIRNTNLASAR